ncbi:lipopolysaccharide transport periplasmic protein LptA [Thioalkalicoccus limnaeus]|uniref:Lipopolysaccharide export system protein LptA n=1 Tax=Thioalkalicoccus limnaeus TaxID=120681 RepID=A0ABV4BF36_9GAMM
MIQPGHDRRHLACALSLLLASWVGSAVPSPAGADDPIQIEADSVQFDDQLALSLYQGQVLVEQGRLRIEADRVEVQHRPDRRPERITAWGDPAILVQRAEGDAPEQRAEARQMTYDVTRDEISLIDRAVLYQGQDRFSSDRILFNRATSQIKAGTSANGTERVRIEITPTP